MIRKITSVFTGFYNYFFKQIPIEIMARERKEICNQCEVSLFGKSDFCLKAKGGCGCFIEAKIRSKEESCPLNKW